MFQVTREVVQVACEIVDGWYPSQGHSPQRIDWMDVWDRLDGTELADGSVLDLGDNLLDPSLQELKRAVKRKLSTDG